MKAVRLMLNSVIDYAGLFPPASLAMDEALEEYAECRAGAFSWALGRFIVPVSRLAELREGIEAFSQGGAGGWPLSVLCGTCPDADRERLIDFERSCAKAPVAAIEWKLARAAEVESVLGAFPNRTAYFEIPICDDARVLIGAVAGRRARAKVRTGGVTPDMFPSPAQLAYFISLCAEARVPFKATAGLHHPLPSVHPLTYAPQSPSVMMHGFLNVLVASAVAYAGCGAETLEQILREERIEAFTFDDASIGWHEWRIDSRRLSEMRDRMFVSFGSCSFREPIDGMKALGFL